MMSGCATSPEATAPSVAASEFKEPTVVACSGADDWQVIASSWQGRPIRLCEMGNGPRKVLFIGGIHGDEPEGAYSTAQLPTAFTDAGLGDAVSLTIIDDANPDGRAAHTRGNARGVDVNRNFPASNFDANNPENGGTPLSQPESKAVVETINAVLPGLVIVFHSWRDANFLNFDGPARELAERFSATSGLPIRESQSFAATPGSLGSYAGRDRGMPVLTIEVRKGSDPEEVWEQLRKAIVQAIAGT